MFRGDNRLYARVDSTVTDRIWVECRKEEEHLEPPPNRVALGH
jgi:hypothetical protein